MASPYTAVSTLASTLECTDKATYTAAHDAATADSEGGGGTTLYIGQNTVFDSLYYIRRGVIKFTIDLGADAATATVTNVTFSGYGAAGIQDDSSGDSISIVSFTPANDADPVAADYDQFGTTKYATDKLISTWSVGSYGVMTFNATGIAAVQAVLSSPKTLWLGFRTAFDVANTTPTKNPQVLIQGYSAGNPPYLTVTYTLPGSNSEFFKMFY